MAHGGGNKTEFLRQVWHRRDREIHFPYMRHTPTPTKRETTSTPLRLCSPPAPTPRASGFPVSTRYCAPADPLVRVHLGTIALTIFFVGLPLVLIIAGFAGSTTCNSRVSRLFLFPFQVVPFHTTQLLSTWLFAVVWRREMNVRMRKV